MVKAALVPADPNNWFRSVKALLALLANSQQGFITPIEYARAFRPSRIQ